MWRLLEQAAKTATANASEYVSTVQEKAQSLAATVQEEAATLLHAIGSARTGPVDELLYEEVEDYKLFCVAFKIDTHTDEISQILEDDDEIRELHEQMVPVQLSYEEFWSRYFFRREQEQLREQREAERKQKQREQEEAKAAAKAVLEEFQVDDDDEEEFDAASVRRDDTRDDLGDGTRDKADEEEDEATLAQLRELRASRKAALQWKQKAAEYQKQLGVLAAKHEEEKKQLKESLESQYQSLCDTYESKMAEITMQIDDARAVGYNEGIQESEAIVATMREDADNEINRLKMEIAQLRQNGSVDAIGDLGSSASLAELDRLKDAMTLKEQVVTALEKQKDELEQALATKSKELESALAQAGAPAVSEGGEEAKKELELWKARAIKMKKLKDQTDAELQKLRDQQSSSGPNSSSEDTAALQTKIAELNAQNEILAAQATAAFAKGALQAETEVRDLSAKLETTQRRLDAVAREEFARGVAAAQKDAEVQLEQLRQQLETANREGEAKAAAKYSNELEQLRSEVATLRAERPSAAVPSSDIFAQADAILSSLASPTSAGLSDGDLPSDTWAVDGEAPAASATPAAPDWGEW